MSARDILHKFKGVKRSGDGWTALCPAHNDERNSLSIGEGESGRLLLHCHAGCTFEAIHLAAGINLDEGKERSARRVASAYDYRDEQGELALPSDSLRAERLQPAAARRRGRVGL